jgi:hypothetical protein
VSSYSSSGQPSGIKGQSTDTSWVKINFPLPYRPGRAPSYSSSGQPSGIKEQSTESSCVKRQSTDPSGMKEQPTDPSGVKGKVHRPFRYKGTVHIHPDFVQFLRIAFRFKGTIRHNSDESVGLGQYNPCGVLGHLAFFLKGIRQFTHICCVCRVAQCSWLSSEQRLAIEGCIKTLSDVAKSR